MITNFWKINFCLWWLKGKSSASYSIGIKFDSAWRQLVFAFIDFLHFYEFFRRSKKEKFYDICSIVFLGKPKNSGSHMPKRSLISIEIKNAYEQLFLVTKRKICFSWLKLRFRHKIPFWSFLAKFFVLTQNLEPEYLIQKTCFITQ